MDAGVGPVKRRESDTALVFVIALAGFGLGLVGAFWIAAVLLAITWYGLRPWRSDGRRAALTFSVAFAVGFLALLVLSTPVGDTSGGEFEVVPAQVEQR